MQIPFAILITQFGFISYMLQDISAFMWSFDVLLFLGLFGGSILSTGLATFFFVRSWYGYSYAYLPAPKEIEDYRVALEGTYSGFANHEELIAEYMRNFIHDTSVECTTKNTSNNDRRSYFAHRTNQFLIIAFILAFLAFLPFKFGEITSSNNAPYKTPLVNDLDQEGAR